jgi:hypothetical protein
MNILPLKSVREEDGQLVGKNLLNLAKLAQAGFPVPEGYVVIPPAFRIKTILEHYDLKDREIFEQKLTILKKDIALIPVPEELKELLLKTKIDARDLWLGFLEEWIQEIRSIIWREGFTQGISSQLLAKLLLFTPKHQGAITAHLDPSSKKLILQKTDTPVSAALQAQLSELISRADKRLFLPQVYSFIIVTKGKSVEPFIVKLAPVTQVVEEKDPKSVVEFATTAPRIGSAVKVLLNPQDRLVVEKSADGVVIDAQETEDFDRLVFQLTESALLFPGETVVFKLSDKPESFGGLRGALRLTNQRSLLKKEVEAYLFVRNKRQLLNVQIAVPFVRGVEEFKALKRDLASLGVARKGTLKMWLEVCTPENIVNLFDYIEVGFDGAIFNIDELAAWFGGFDHTTEESVYYKKELSGLLTFITPAMKKLHQLRKPILVSGATALSGDMLPKLLELGIWGVVAGNESASFLKEEIGFLEKKIVQKKG